MKGAGVGRSPAYAVIVISFHVAVPLGLVTDKLPVFAFGGTVKVIFVLEATLNFAGTPWNVTEVVPLKFVPVSVRLAPRRVFFGRDLRDRGHRGSQRQEAVLDEHAWPAGLRT